MRVEQMRSREDFDQVLAATLSTGWSEECGLPVTVRYGGSGQVWLYEPMFSAFCLPSANGTVRRFMRSMLQFTPARFRLPAQWVLAQLLGSPPGLRLAGHEGFTVEPGLSCGEELLVVPGNQRIRVFDFGRGTTRVFLKAGFDSSGLRNESAVRSAGKAGPFIPITLSGSTWFEEPIHEGYSIPRCPPWWDQELLAESALDKLEDWISGTERSVAAADYSEILEGRLVHELVILAVKSEERDAMIGAVHNFASLSSQLGELIIGQGHGDFQPGNVLVSRDGREVTIIDWEHSAERWRDYDRFTWALGARYGGRLVSRIAAYVDGKPPRALVGKGASRRERQQLIALFLLEDILWFARESTSGPFTRVSAGLTLRINELPRLLDLVSRGG